MTYGLINWMVSILFFSQLSLANQVNISPSGTVSSEGLEQVRVQFPETMVKKDSAFKVTCQPEVGGFSSWADNNTTWVYNLQYGVDQWGDSLPLPGGTVCAVEQTDSIESASGKVWSIGTIAQTFSVSGPNVKNIYKVPGLNEMLREENPVFMVVFDGDILTETLYNNPGSFLWYPLGSNAPSEKILLAPVPSDKTNDLYEAFDKSYYLNYYGVRKESKNWAFVTVNRSLKPGQKIELSLTNITSAYNSNIKSSDYHETLQVRPGFNPMVTCSRVEGNDSLCQPEGGISVQFNAEVQWNKASKVYVEYVPKNSKTGAKEIAYPNASGVEKSWLGWIANKLNLDSVDQARVRNLDFDNIAIAAESSLKVVFPNDLTDVDSRPLSISEFALQFGSYSEVIRVTRNFSIMERLAKGNDFLPISVMNLRQKIKIKQVGAQGKNWEPLQSPNQIIDVVSAYNNLQNSYDEDAFVSPLSLYNIKTTTVEMTLKGDKNKLSLINVPFGVNKKNQKGGLYVLEIASSLSPDQKPVFAVTMLTDLNVHLKKGTTQTDVWVTSYSTGRPVPGAKVQIFSCDKTVAVELTTDNNGLTKFKNDKVSSECDSSDSYMNSTGQFYVFAKTANDLAFTHSNDYTEGSWAMGAPGVEYFNSSISDNEPFIHTVIGVNLVKPGQAVPVQLMATMPTNKGFTSVDSSKLPKSVQIRNINNSELAYDFNLQWDNGQAELLWDVPKSAELGLYEITYTKAGQNWPSSLGEGIEVSEFKVPVMSGSLQLSPDQAVKPSAINLTGFLRYANGVGAKEQNVDLTYYFSPTSLQTEKYAEFYFTRGEFNQTNTNESSVLPTAENSAVITGLQTNQEGSVLQDLANQTLSNGQTVLEALAQTKQPYDLIARMKFQDQMGEFQTLSTSTTLYNSSSYIGTKVEKGNLSTARLLALNLGTDGKAYSNPSDLKLKVLSVKTHVVSEEIFGGLVKNILEKELVATNWSSSACLSSDGLLSCSLGSLKSGQYIFTAESMSTGQKTYSLFDVNADGSVTGENDYYYFDQSEHSLTLASDKEKYTGQDAAKLSFNSPFAECTALVSLERGDVVETSIDENACSNGYVTVPMNSKYAPNIFAAVYLVTGRPQSAIKVNDFDLGKPSYRIGFANLKLNWDAYELKVKVATDKKEYKPRDTAQVSIQVTDSSGQPVNGDVTLVVLEEKILELRNNNSFNLIEAFLGMRNHNVSLINTSGYLNSVATDQATELGDPAAAIEAKSGDDGGDGEALEAFKRELFDSLVAWKTNIQVIDGVAQTDFTVNDKLTRFKVFALANNKQTQFGTGTADYISAQEIQTYANLPSVGRTGDSFPLSATLQNNSEQNQNLTIVFNYIIYGPNGEIIEQGQKEGSILLASNGSQVVSADTLRIPDGSSAVKYEVNVYSKDGLLVDRLTPDTQKISPAVPLAVQDQYLVQMQKGQYSIELKKSEDSLPEQGLIETQVATSLVDTARLAIQKNINEDPFVGLTVESQLLKALINSSSTNNSDLVEAYAELLGQVDNKGMIKYYKGDSRGNFWLTSDLLRLLAMEPWALNIAPQSLKDKWVNSLQEVVNGAIDPAYVSTEANNSLWTAARLKAIAALVGLDQDLAASLASPVLDEVNKTLSSASLEVLVDAMDITATLNPEQIKSSPLYNKIMGGYLTVVGSTALVNTSANFGLWGYVDEIIATSKLASALSKSSALSADDYLDNLVNGLISAQTENKWYTTRTQLWVLKALADFAKGFEETPVDGITSILSSINGIKTDIIWSNGTQKSGVDLNWPSQTAEIEIKHQGAGQPWVSITAKEAKPVSGLVTQGLKVVKTMVNLTRNDGSYKTGDLIQVNITISAPNSMNHVQLFDAIPAGANILSEGWGAMSSSQLTYSGYQAYFSYLDEGDTELSYQYQLNNPGVFKLSPTRVEAIYFPSIFGAAENKTMTIVR